METADQNQSRNRLFQSKYAETLSALLVILYWVWLALQSPLGSRWLDFPVYWEAGLKALEQRTVYDVAGHFQYKYSPLFALIFGYFFKPFSFSVVSWIFQKLMLGIWIFLFHRLALWNWKTVLILLLFFGNALRLDLALGQLNALVLFLLFFAFQETERDRGRGRDIRLILTFFFAVQIKLFSLLLIPYWILKKEWRVLIGSLLFLPLGTWGGIAALGGVEYASTECVAWFSSLAASTDELILSEQNVGILGFISRAFGVEVGRIIWVILGVAYFYYLIRTWKKTFLWRVGHFLAIVPLFNPLVWSYWILYLLPLLGPKALEFVGSFRRKDRRTLGVKALAILLVFFAFNGQHARWAWEWGILASILTMGIWVANVRDRETEARNLGSF